MEWMPSQLEPCVGKVQCSTWAISVIMWVMNRADSSQWPHFTHVMGYYLISPTGASIKTRKLSRASQVEVHYVGKCGHWVGFALVITHVTPEINNVT